MRTTRPFVALAAAAIAILSVTGCSSSSTQPPVNTPTPAAETPTPTPTPTPTAEPTVGSRQAPLALGETRQITEDSAYIVGITAVDYDAWAAIQASDSHHDAPVEGSQYVVANVSLALNGDNLTAQGLDITNEGLEPGFALNYEYVAADGTSYDSINSECYTDNMLYSQGAVYDASIVTTGDVCVAIPSAALPGGLWRISNSQNDAVWVQGS